MPRGNQVHDRNMITAASEPLLVDASKQPAAANGAVPEGKPEKVVRAKDGELLAISDRWHDQRGE